MNTKVLVTGGTGFLGAYILQELVLQGFSVRATRRRRQTPFYIPQDILSKVEWVDGDILDVVSLQEAMQGMDAVIHSAAKVSFNPRDKSALYKINIEGTANVVNAAIEANVKRFVQISSVAAIGRDVSGEMVAEEKKWQPGKYTTPYAVSKHLAEMEVWRGGAEGLKTLVVNPSTILGYGDWHTSSCAIFKSVYDEFPWYTTGINGFAGVEDVAKAVVLLMQTDTSGQRYIVNNANWSFQQLLNTIADGFGKKRPHKEATPFLAAIAWRMEKVKSFFSGKSPLLTRHSARIAQSKTHFDNRKLLAALPQFSFAPLEQSITNACRQYLDNPPPQ